MPDLASLAAAYERDGYVIARGLLPPQLVAELARHTERELVPLCGAGGKDAPGAQQIQSIYDRSRRLTVAKVNQLTERDPAFTSLSHHGALVDAVEAVLGVGARKFRDVLIIKPARSEGFFSYHQDSAYWDVEPKALVSCWVPLGDVSEAASCLRVVPGSHRALLRHGMFWPSGKPVPRVLVNALRKLVSVAGTGDAPRSTGGNLVMWRLKRAITEATRRMPAITSLLDYRVDPEELAAWTPRAVALPVAAGDVILFHSLLLHSSGANLTDHARYASIISYMSREARFVGRGTPRFVAARLAGPA